MIGPTYYCGPDHIDLIGTVRAKLIGNKSTHSGVGRNEKGAAIYTSLWIFNKPPCPTPLARRRCDLNPVFKMYNFLYQFASHAILLLTQEVKSHKVRSLELAAASPS